MSQVHTAYMANTTLFSGLAPQILRRPDGGVQITMHSPVKASDTTIVVIGGGLSVQNRVQVFAAIMSHYWMRVLHRSSFDEFMTDVMTMLTVNGIGVQEPVLDGKTYTFA